MSPERELFLAACETGDVEAVRRFLAAGTRVWDSGDEWTALHRAVFSGSLSLIDLLIAEGAPLEAKYGSGMTPLADAAAQGTPEVVERLLSAGALLDATDEAGRTPLMRAAVMGKAATVAALLRGGADAAQRDTSGYSAEDIARIHGFDDVAELLRAELSPTR